MILEKLWPVCYKPPEVQKMTFTYAVVCSPSSQFLYQNLPCSDVEGIGVDILNFRAAMRPTPGSFPSTPVRSADIVVSCKVRGGRV
jgi:hypothetical protein